MRATARMYRLIPAFRLDTLDDYFWIARSPSNRVGHAPHGRSREHEVEKAEQISRAMLLVSKASTSMRNPPAAPRTGTMKDSPSQLIDGRIKELGDWRGDTLARIRALIKQADPDVVEEWK